MILHIDIDRYMIKGVVVFRARKTQTSTPLRQRPIPTYNLQHLQSRNELVIYKASSGICTLPTVLFT